MHNNLAISFSLLSYLGCFLFSLTPMAFAEPQIYLSGQGSTIARYPSDGSNRDEILQSYYVPNYAAVDRTNSRFYWGAAQKIMRCAFDGSNFEIVFDHLDGLSNVTGVAVDPVNGYIFWTDYYASSIWRGNIDGTGTPEAIYTGASSPVGIDVDTDNGHIYWGQQGNARIMRGNISGLGTPTQITATGGGVTGVAVDSTNEKLYWANFGGQTLDRSDLDGNNNETLFNNGDGVAASAGISLDIANGLLYWVNANGIIYRGNSDGSGALTQLFDVSATDSTSQGVGVSPDGTQILFTGDVNIYSGASDGSGTASTAVNLSNAPYTPGYLAIDVSSRELFFSDSFPSAGIKKVDLEFEAITSGILEGTISTLFDNATDNVTDVSGLAYDSSSDLLYWSDSATQKIQRGSNDGTGAVTDLYDNGDGLTFPQDLVLDADADLLYWIDANDVTILRANADGTGAPTVLFQAADGLTNPRGLALDPSSDMIYWGDITDDLILRANSDGTGAITTLWAAADGISNPDSIQLDAENGKIYISDSGAEDALLVGNMDGTGALEALITGLSAPNRLLLLADADDDGYPDGVDQCESDSAKTEPGDCGCGVVDADTNSNSISDCLINADAKDRIATLRSLVSSLKWTGTPNKKRNKKRRKAQKSTLVEIQSIHDELDSTMTTNLNSYTLASPSLNLSKRLKKALRKTRRAKKTKTSNFKKRKKQAKKTLLKLNNALTDS